MTKNKGYFKENVGVAMVPKKKKAKLEGEKGIIKIHYLVVK